MKKDIKDYLHLYLGCECRCFCNEDTSGWPDKITLGLLMEYAYPDSGLFISPILRPLSSMTEEEAKELFILEHHRIETNWISITLTKQAPSKFESKLKYEPSWRVSAKYKLDNSKESGMAGSLSLETFNSAQFSWLLKKQFDLFGLIDSGLAVNAETLK